MTEVVPSAQNKLSEAEPDRLYLSDWIWRPWYAKIVWMSSASLWGGGAISFFVPALRPFYGSSVGAVLMGFSFPPLVAFILGAGFVRDYFRNRTETGEWVAAPYEEQDLPWGRPSMGGRYNNPYIDHVDPRSGPDWIGGAN